MKHFRDNGDKVALVRISVDMLPKSVQRAGRDKQFDIMKKIFKRACENYGIPHELKEREYYVKPGEKKRKAKRLKKAVARGEIKLKEDYDRNNGGDKFYGDDFNF